MITDMKSLKKVLKLSGWEKEGKNSDKKIELITKLLKQAGFRSSRNTARGWDRFNLKFSHPLGLTAILIRDENLKSYSFSIHLPK